MHDNLLFSAQKAQELDELAQKIDPRLIMFCGYTPDENYFHPEAGFTKGCLNLYKCTVDGMILWKKLTNSAYKKHLPADGEETLKELDDKQDILRSILAHNNAEENGFSQKQRIEEYKKWVANVTGTPVLDTEAKYQLALNAVLDLGERMFLLLKTFLINAMNASRWEKDKLVRSWISDTASWYSQKKFHQIYMEYLRQHILGRDDVRNKSPEGIVAASSELMRNSMKYQADMKRVRVVGYSNQEEYICKCNKLMKRMNPQEMLNRISADEKLAESDCKKEYERIDELPSVETEWQTLLKRQLIDSAAKVSSLAPSVWLDEHINTHICPREIGEKEYEPIDWDMVRKIT